MQCVFTVRGGGAPSPGPRLSLGPSTRIAKFWCHVHLCYLVLTRLWHVGLKGRAFSLVCGCGCGCGCGCASSHDGPIHGASSLPRLHLLTFGGFWGGFGNVKKSANPSISDWDVSQYERHPRRSISLSLVSAPFCWVKITKVNPDLFIKTRFFNRLCACDCELVPRLAWWISCSSSAGSTLGKIWFPLTEGTHTHTHTHRFLLPP